MTAEQVEYYRALLLVGLGDAFYASFDRALEEENPLSSLTLSLCDCISNETEVLHILRVYTLEHPFHESTVRDLLQQDMAARYQAGQISRPEFITKLYDIASVLEKSTAEEWTWFTTMSCDLELLGEGLICEEVFNESFDAWWNTGKRLDVWALQRQHTLRNRLHKIPFWKRIWKK